MYVMRPPSCVWRWATFPPVFPRFFLVLGVLFEEALRGPGVGQSGVGKEPRVFMESVGGRGFYFLIFFL